jgi:hypothetical protein
MRIVLISLACAGTVMVSAQPAFAQDVRPAVFHVHKKGDTLSVANAVVTVDHIIEAGKTDAHGIAKLDELEDGGHIVEITAPGYEYIFDQFDSGPNIKQPIELELTVDKRQMNAVKGPAVGLKLAEFEQRRLKAVGTFLTRAQLDKASGRPLANVLQIDLGATIVSERGGEFLVSSDPASGSNPCYTAVVRDGFRVYPVESATPPDFGKVFAEQFAAVEFYKRPALVPAELRDAAACGALVIWTRDAR